MTDSMTHKRIEVLADAEGRWPHLIVPVDQLDAVTEILRAGGLSFWPDSETLSMNGEPPVVFINFASGTDGRQVQRLLDAAS